MTLRVKLVLLLPHEAPLTSVWCFFIYIMSNSGVFEDKPTAAVTDVREEAKNWGTVFAGAPSPDSLEGRFLSRINSLSVRILSAVFEDAGAIAAQR